MTPPTPNPEHNLTLQHYLSLTHSSAMAHEKAYNHLQAPKDRLAHLSSLPEAERERPDVAKKIDQAEVDLGKREAQLEATAGIDDFKDPTMLFHNHLFVYEHNHHRYAFTSDARSSLFSRCYNLL